MLHLPVYVSETGRDEALDTLIKSGPDALGRGIYFG